MKNHKKVNSLCAGEILIRTFLILLMILILFPFYNAIIISIVPESVFIRTPLLLYPKKITFDSYKYLFQTGTLNSGLMITTIVTIIGTLYNMFLSVLCAYCLTKPFPGRKFISLAIIFTIYFNGGLIPNYMLVRNLGLMNKVSSMILPLGVSYMYMIVILRTIQDIPISLEESAKLDGANEIIILFKIILPLCKPILATFTLYYAVDRWNEWWEGMLYIQQASKQPLQLVLRNIVQDLSDFTGASSGDDSQTFSEGMRMASTLISTLPIMCVYPFLQKYFIGGLTVGAVKE